MSYDSFFVGAFLSLEPPYIVPPLCSDVELDRTAAGAVLKLATINPEWNLTKATQCSSLPPIPNNLARTLTH